MNERYDNESGQYVNDVLLNANRNDNSRPVFSQVMNSYPSRRTCIASSKNCGPLPTSKLSSSNQMSGSMAQRSYSSNVECRSGNIAKTAWKQPNPTEMNIPVCMQLSISQSSNTWTGKQSFSQCEPDCCPCDSSIYCTVPQQRHPLLLQQHQVNLSTGDNHYTHSNNQQVGQPPYGRGSHILAYTPQHCGMLGEGTVSEVGSRSVQYIPRYNVNQRTRFQVCDNNSDCPPIRPTTENHRYSLSMRNNTVPQLSCPGRVEVSTSYRGGPDRQNDSFQIRPPTGTWDRSSCNDLRMTAQRNALPGADWRCGAVNPGHNYMFSKRNVTCTERADLCLVVSGGETSRNFVPVTRPVVHSQVLSHQPVNDSSHTYDRHVPRYQHFLSHHDNTCVSEGSSLQPGASVGVAVSAFSGISNLPSYNTTALTSSQKLCNCEVTSVCNSQRNTSIVVNKAASIGYGSTGHNTTGSVGYSTTGCNTTASVRYNTTGHNRIRGKNTKSGYNRLTGSMRYSTTGHNTTGSVQYSTTGHNTTGSMRYSTTGHNTTGSVRYSTSGHNRTGSLQYTTAGHNTRAIVGYSATDNNTIGNVRYSTTGNNTTGSVGYSTTGHNTTGIAGYSATGNNTIGQLQYSTTCNNTTGSVGYSTTGGNRIRGKNTKSGYNRLTGSVRYSTTGHNRTGSVRYSTTGHNTTGSVGYSTTDNNTIGSVGYSTTDNNTTGSVGYSTTDNNTIGSVGYSTTDNNTTGSVGYSTTDNNTIGSVGYSTTDNNTIGSVGYSTTGHNTTGSVVYSTTANNSTGNVRYSTTGNNTTGRVEYNTTGNNTTGSMGYNTTGCMGYNTTGHNTAGSVGYSAKGGNTTGSVRYSTVGNNTSGSIGSSTTGNNTIRNIEYCTTSNNTTGNVGYSAYANNTTGHIGYSAYANNATGHIGYSTTSNNTTGSVGYSASGNDTTGSIGYSTIGNNTTGSIGYSTTGNNLTGNLGYSASGNNTKRSIGNSTTGNLEYSTTGHNTTGSVRYNTKDTNTVGSVRYSTTGNNTIRGRNTISGHNRLTSVRYSTTSHNTIGSKNTISSNDTLTGSVKYSITGRNTSGNMRYSTNGMSTSGSVGYSTTGMSTSGSVGYSTTGMSTSGSVGYSTTGMSISGSVGYSTTGMSTSGSVGYSTTGMSTSGSVGYSTTGMSTSGSVGYSKTDNNITGSLRYNTTDKNKISGHNRQTSMLYNTPDSNTTSSNTTTNVVNRTTGSNTTANVVYRTTGSNTTANVVYRTTGSNTTANVVNRSTGSNTTANVVNRSTGSNTTTNVVNRTTGSNTTANVVCSTTCSNTTASVVYSTTGNNKIPLCNYTTSTMEYETTYSNKITTGNVWHSSKNNKITGYNRINTTFNNITPTGSNTTGSGMIKGTSTTASEECSTTGNNTITSTRCSKDRQEMTANNRIRDMGKGTVGDNRIVNVRCNEIANGKLADAESVRDKPASQHYPQPQQTYHRGVGEFSNKWDASKRTNNHSPLPLASYLANSIKLGSTSNHQCSMKVHKFIETICCVLAKVINKKCQFFLENAQNAEEVMEKRWFIAKLESIVSSAFQRVIVTNQKFLSNLCLQQVKNSDTRYAKTSVSIGFVIHAVIEETINESEHDSPDRSDESVRQSGDQLISACRSNDESKNRSDESMSRSSEKIKTIAMEDKGNTIELTWLFDSVVCLLVENWTDVMRSANIYENLAAEATKKLRCLFHSLLNCVWKALSSNEEEQLCHGEGRKCDQMDDVSMVTLFNLFFIQNFRETPITSSTEDNEVLPQRMKHLKLLDETNIEDKSLTGGQYKDMCINNPISLSVLPSRCDVQCSEIIEPRVGYNNGCGTDNINSQKLVQDLVKTRSCSSNDSGKIGVNFCVDDTNSSNELPKNFEESKEKEVNFCVSVIEQEGHAQKGTPSIVNMECDLSPAKEKRGEETRSVSIVQVNDDVYSQLGDHEPANENWKQLNMNKGEAFSNVIPDFSLGKFNSTNCANLHQGIKNSPELVSNIEMGEVCPDDDDANTCILAQDMEAMSQLYGVGDKKELGDFYATSKETENTASVMNCCEYTGQVDMQVSVERPWMVQECENLHNESVSSSAELIEKIQVVSFEERTNGDKCITSDFHDTVKVLIKKELEDYSPDEYHSRDGELLDGSQEQNVPNTLEHVHGEVDVLKDKEAEHDQSDLKKNWKNIQECRQDTEHILLQKDKLEGEGDGSFNKHLQTAKNKNKIQNLEENKREKKDTDINIDSRNIAKEKRSKCGHGGQGIREKKISVHNSDGRHKEKADNLYSDVREEKKDSINSDDRSEVEGKNNTDHSGFGVGDKEAKRKSTQQPGGRGQAKRMESINMNNRDDRGLAKTRGRINVNIQNGGGKTGRKNGMNLEGKAKQNSKIYSDGEDKLHSTTKQHCKEARNLGKTNCLKQNKTTLAHEVTEYDYRNKMTKECCKQLGSTECHQQEETSQDRETEFVQKDKTALEKNVTESMHTDTKICTQKMHQQDPETCHQGVCEYVQYDIECLIHKLEKNFLEEKDTTQQQQQCCQDEGGISRLNMITERDIDVQRRRTEEDRQDVVEKENTGFLRHYLTAEGDKPGEGQCLIEGEEQKKDVIKMENTELQGHVVSEEEGTGALGSCFTKEEDLGIQGQRMTAEYIQKDENIKELQGQVMSDEQGIGTLGSYFTGEKDTEIEEEQRQDDIKEENTELQGQVMSEEEWNRALMQYLAEEDDTEVQSKVIMKDEDKKQCGIKEESIGYQGIVVTDEKEQIQSVIKQEAGHQGEIVTAEVEQSREDTVIQKLDMTEEEGTVVLKQNWKEVTTGALIQNLSNCDLGFERYRAVKIETASDEDSIDTSCGRKEMFLEMADKICEDRTGKDITNVEDFLYSITKDNTGEDTTYDGCISYSMTRKVKKMTEDCAKVHKMTEDFTEVKQMTEDSTNNVNIPYTNTPLESVDDGSICMGRTSRVNANNVGISLNKTSEFFDNGISLSRRRKIGNVKRKTGDGANSPDISCKPADQVKAYDVCSSSEQTKKVAASGVGNFSEQRAKSSVDEEMNLSEEMEFSNDTISGDGPVSLSDDTASTENGVKRPKSVFRSFFEKYHKACEFMETKTNENNIEFGSCIMKGPYIPHSKNQRTQKDEASSCLFDIKLSYPPYYIRNCILKSGKCLYPENQNMDITLKNMGHINKSGSNSTSTCGVEITDKKGEHIVTLSSYIDQNMCTFLKSINFTPESRDVEDKPTSSGCHTIGVGNNISDEQNFSRQKIGEKHQVGFKKENKKMVSTLCHNSLNSEKNRTNMMGRQKIVGADRMVGIYGNGDNNNVRSNHLKSCITKSRVKERKTYTDIDLDDDEIEGKRNYTLDEKLKSTKYNNNYVKVLKGEEFSLKYIQENGLECPIVFYEKSGLGLRVPSENFKVSDVKQCVGSRRMLDVMDVNTQKGMEMSMREWVQYYESDQRKRLLNVISLEFSHTKLENYVESPNLVRQIDWVDTVWPKHLKECQTESTNIIEKMKYPKVQKYCLMSVQGCYTDFHIDFGGTSVWYHVLHGQKVFWLIPPTERNVEIYTNWVLSAKQGDVFLADQVEGCQRLDLQAGYTFIIPSGWIHAVYTPKDSLVFGGNFLHSYNIINQLRVSDVEDKTHVPQKFRYPFYAEIAWYVLARYITCVTGKQCLETPAEDKENGDDKRELSPFIQDESRPSSRCSQDNDFIPNKTDTNVRPSTPKLSKSVTIELTRIDQSPLRKSFSDDEGFTPRWLHSPRKSSSDSCSSADTEIYEKPEDILGLVVSNGSSEKNGKNSVRKIKSESEGKKGDNSVPKRVNRNSSKKEVKTVYLTKCEVDGLQMLMDWLESLPVSKKGVPKDMIDADEVISDMKQLLQDHANDDQSLACSGEPILVWPPSKKPLKVKIYKTGAGLKTPKSQQSSSKGSPSTGVRRRRTRCRKCEPCTRTDCGECNFCKDMKKYGGPGRMKQSCKSRQCLAPVLPNAATCMICGKDERIKSPDNPEETVTTLMECGICWEIVHPDCLKNKYENLDNEGVINEDLPNSWECPKCCHDGKQGQLKPRLMKVKKEVSVKSPEYESPTSPPVAFFPEEVKVESEGKRVTSKQSIEQKEEDIKMEIDTEEEDVTADEMEMDSDPVSPSVSKSGKKKLEKSQPKTVMRTKEKKSPLRFGKYGKLSSKGHISLSPTKSSKVMVRGKSGSSIVKNISSIQKRSSRFLPLEKSASSDGLPESVITRSGRKVKRSPQLSDENVETDMPRKRPRRECLVSRPEVTKRNGVKVTRGQGVRSTSVHQRTKRHQSIGTSSTDDTVESPERVVYPLKKTVYGSGQQKSQLNKSKSSPALGQGSRKKKFGSDRKGTNDFRFDKSQQQMRNETVSGQAHGETRDGMPKLKLNRFVVRPVAPPPPPDCVEMETDDNHPLKRQHWTKIFSFLNYHDLARCLSVCTAFNRWGMNHLLWKTIDLSRKRICQPHLIGIVKRQPTALILNNVVMTQSQLSWLIARIPQLKDLSLSSCSWATVSALCFSVCPLLHSLNLNWILGMNNQCFKDLVSPPTDLRPGMQEISRLHRLKSLSVAGTEIGDESLGHIAQYLVQLEELDISYCARVTDEGLRILVSTNNGSVAKTLSSLDISGSQHFTNTCLKYLVKCENLSTVKMVKCPLITMDSITSFQRKSVMFVK